MNRRDLLQSLAAGLTHFHYDRALKEWPREARLRHSANSENALAAGALPNSFGEARNPAGPAPPFPPQLQNVSTTEPLLHLENGKISAALFPDASAIFIDRENGRQWRMGPVAIQEESPIDMGAVWLRSERSICEQYPGRFRGRREGGNIRFWLMDRLMRPKGSFLVHVSLGGSWIEYRILEIEERLPSLGFPPAIESDSLVLPMHVGRWIQQPVASRFFYTFFSHLNMRWFGGLKQDRAWMALFPEENFVDSGVMLAEMSASPVWLKELGAWSRPRAIRYQFLAGGYVELARSYRQWTIDRGIHRGLRAKLADTPALGSLLNGRLVSIVEANPMHGKKYDEEILAPWRGDSMLGRGPRVMFTHDQALSCIRKLPQAGVPRALVVVRGWGPGGYDYFHPDVWPPEPKLGSIADFKRLCQGFEHFPVALHDNYQDMYPRTPSWPHGVIRERDGELMPGGYWAGGQAYIVNARAGLGYARRNWRHLRQLGLRAYFVDTTSAVQMYQSYQPGKTLTRIQDLANKAEMLRFFKSMGVVLGSEEGADFAIPYLDWNENRHSRQPGESVPLWPLVFHDAVVSGRYLAGNAAADWAGGVEAGAAYPPWLEDMLWGYASMSHLEDYSRCEADLSAMQGTLRVDAWFRRIATAAMTDHRFLEPGFSLEQARFSNGMTIRVNFSGEPQSYEGIETPAKGFKILKESVGVSACRRERL